MPTVFKHALVTQIGTNPTDVVEIGAGVRATVIGCNLANVTEYDTVVVDIQVVGVDTTVAYYVKGLIIPPNTSVKVITQGEKLILPADTELRMVSDTADSVDATVSYVEIS
jgi:uncharacterized UPF0146 family protein